MKSIKECVICECNIEKKFGTKGILVENIKTNEERYVCYNCYDKQKEKKVSRIPKCSLCKNWKDENSIVCKDCIIKELKERNRILKLIDERIKRLNYLTRLSDKRKDRRLGERLKNIYVLKRLELENLKSKIENGNI